MISRSYVKVIGQLCLSGWDVTKIHTGPKVAWQKIISPQPFDTFIAFEMTLQEKKHQNIVRFWYNACTVTRFRMVIAIGDIKVICEGQGHSSRSRSPSKEILFSLNLLFCYVYWTLICQPLPLHEAQSVIKVVTLGRWAHHNVKLHFFFASMDKDYGLTEIWSCLHYQVVI